MAESPKYQSNPPESKRDANRSRVTVKQVVVHYSVLDQNGTTKEFSVELDPVKAGAVVWNADDKDKFLKGKTTEEEPLPGELPVPKPSKLLGDSKDQVEADAPEGTCCFINGRWVCW